MEKTIEIKGIDLAQLIGPADANLKMVEGAFSSQIIVRGSKIKIIGCVIPIDLGIPSKCRIKIIDKKNNP